MIYEENERIRKKKADKFRKSGKLIMNP